MIWFDLETQEPIAPGACEDAGQPSVEGYDCPHCNKHAPVEYETYNVVQNAATGIVRQYGFGICSNCRSIVLYTG